jgi:hypothetical protein
VFSVRLSGMLLPFSGPLYHPIAPDKFLATDERKMSPAVLKLAALRFLSILRNPQPGSCIAPILWGQKSTAHGRAPA